jgi:hypothetical protein
LFRAGTVARLQDHARAGITLVLVPALRFGEETFLGHLAARGAIPRQAPAERALALSISAREMAFAAVNGLHSEIGLRMERTVFRTNCACRMVASTRRGRNRLAFLELGIFAA